MSPYDDAAIDRAFEATTPPQRRSHRWYFLIGLSLAALFIPALRGDDLGLPRGSVIIVPSIIAFSIMSIVAAITRRRRRRRAEIVTAWDAVQLEDWQAAESALLPNLATPIHSPIDRCQAFIALAALAEQRRNYDAAIRIYQQLLIDRIGDPVQLQHAQISMTTAKIRNEELTDGLQMLDRLERFEMPQALKAFVAWTRLYQRVFMGQFEDAVAGLAEARALFRRFLSTKAGYAYALIATAMHHLARHDVAARYWLDATTLVSSQRLIQEYPLLAPVAGTYPAAEHPL
ncbi:MAG: hypothetical protein KF841_08625 [Phycisphaerae bacterium]|nr:hypothetical protein [Phycisphaerae bacterium]